MLIAKQGGSPKEKKKALQQDEIINFNPRSSCELTQPASRTTVLQGREIKSPRYRSQLGKVLPLLRGRSWRGVGARGRIRDWRHRCWWHTRIFGGRSLNVGVCNRR